MGVDELKLYVVSSPSGGGKSTVVKEIIRRDPTICYSISATTRPRRKGETNGKDYHFWDQNYFLDQIKKNAFIEWFQVHGYYYGTLWSEIEYCAKQGKNMLLDIDVNGGLEIKKHRSDAVLIFLLPPSMKILEERLRLRGTEEENELNIRLKKAKEEIDRAQQYDYQIVNNILEKTIDEFWTIIKSHSNSLVN